MTDTGRITAVLGPTNTGKTTYAIERMLGYRTGIIGLPLRLLAREVYDRIVALRGPSVVALVTGEERIVPERTQYWVCTVEAMPPGMGCDFLAIDEIQLCADAERGHVFTDRLLRARGLHETLFLGADTMRNAIAANVPKVQFMRRERFSQLTYAGSKKISRLQARSAIVGFSVENVYAIAELLRRQKGGAAVVMGALSPRTRNAQVEMYQNGDVDYLVATDAIGMGLNLDIRHVAFSATRKFDGRRMRELAPEELAQIAGRAGRHVEDGTFGVTGEARPLSDEVALAITEHSFAPIRKLQWRNDRLNFGSIAGLIASLEAPTQDEWLLRARDSDDLVALRTLAEVPEVRDRVRDVADVRQLWDVCRIPDFRDISAAEHANLLERIFGFLQEWGRVPDDWLAQQVRRIDRVDGDIDTLSKRLAHIRTWTYVAQRKGWVDDEKHWRGATRAVEDRLSDALHGALTQRFVDRRTSVLLRRLKQKESLVAEVNDKGEVTVEGQFVGRLDGFRFRQDQTASGDEAKTLQQAALAALGPEFHLRSDRFYNAPDPEIDFTEQGGLIWGSQAVGKLVAGPEPLRPGIEVFVDDEAGPEVIQKVQRRLQHFIDRKIAALFEPLLTMQRDEALTGIARGFAFRLIEGFGILPRAEIAAEVKELDQDARALLRKHGVRFGQFTVFLPLLLKPAPTRLRLVLWSLAKGFDVFPESPPPGLVTIPVVEGVPDGSYTLSGYRPAGQRAIRIDMAERLADMLRACDSRGGFEAAADMLSITGLSLEQFADLMGGLGYHAVKGERPKVRPSPVVAKEAPKVDAGDASPAEDDSAAVGADTGAPAAASPGDMAQAEETAAADDDQQAADTSQAAGDDQSANVTADSAAEQHDDAAVTAADDEANGTEQPVEAAVEAAEAAVTSRDAPARDAEAATPTDPATDDEAPIETEVFYTFTWAGNRGARRETQGKRPQRGGGRPAGDARPRGGKGPKKAGPKAQKGAKSQAKPSRPQRQDKPIDPDNPFAAALMGFKDKL